MSKQSDIREGLRSFIEKAQVETHYDGSHTEKENAGYINDILEYLHSQGVVIRVDDYLVTQFNSQNATVEPLIEGGE